ncbi:hypothetical protein ERJ75_001593600 [Trypanosoma vivax]|nr:hypothetical protein ERJ75_001593600 [Trypanosoma vivax]
MNGWSLPCNLPNAASSAAYASKYLFLRYTLQMDEAFMEQFTSSLTEAICGKSSHLSFAHLVAQCNAQAGQQGQLEVEGGEMVVQSLVTWLCASFLVRITAEALGDVLRHVEASLKEHMQLAMRCTAGAAQGDSRQEWLKVEKDLQLFLDRIALVRPRHSVYQCIGRRPPRRLRLRVIPFEAFPEIYRRMRLPFEAEAKQADACTAKPRRTSTARSGRSMASVVASSAIAQKHIDRACSALDWASMVLTHCTTFLRHLPVEAPQSQPPGPSSPHNAPVVIPSASSPFYSGAAGDNFARCEALVRSRVQNDVDSLFRYISWNELEEQLQSLSRPDEGGKDSGSDEGLTSSLVDAGFLSDFLTDSMGGPESGSAVVGQCETDAKVGTVCQRPSKTYSRDEERALNCWSPCRVAWSHFKLLWPN